ncbi:MAG: hypothetical protein EOP53_10745 [Sphingobacteriales bacterium]|nr:MAG: hypothetical protein EOP53_10745 [Sphingobacteriales bacterium]
MEFRFFLIFSIFCKQILISECTFLKTKEIANLEVDMMNVNRRLEKCEQSISALSVKEPCSCIAICKQLEEKIAQLTEKTGILEFKITTSLGPNSPGSLNRRPAIKRLASSDARLSPYNTPSARTNYPADDYFSPASPYT